MSDKKIIIPLRWHPQNIHYASNQNDDSVGTNRFIMNYSQGVPIKNVHSKIRHLTKNHYVLLDEDVGGDAPKDFIRVYAYGEGKKNKTKKWNKHIAKVGHKWYPLESINEHLLNRIGEVLGLNMAKSQLRIIHGQMRFLSRYFLKKDELMVHGAQIYSTFLLENDDRFVDEIENENLSRELLTFQFTSDAIKSMFPDQFNEIMNYLVELLVFDAITGNNDRHFYNWAIITNITGKKTPKFSPIYDSARGLFWNIPETVIDKNFYQGKKPKEQINTTALDKYLNSSRPKIGWDNWNGDKEINHFQLVSKIYEHYPLFKNTCKNLINEIHLHRILELLETEFATFYTPKRLYLMKECLKRRFEILNNLCKSDCYD